MTEMNIGHLLIQLSVLKFVLKQVDEDELASIIDETVGKIAETKGINLSMSVLSEEELLEKIKEKMAEESQPIPDDQYMCIGSWGDVHLRARAYKIGKINRFRVLNENEQYWNDEGYWTETGDDQNGTMYEDLEQAIVAGQSYLAQIAGMSMEKVKVMLDLDVCTDTGYDPTRLEQFLKDSLAVREVEGPVDVGGKLISLRIGGVELQ